MLIASILGENIQNKYLEVGRLVVILRTVVQTTITNGVVEYILVNSDTPTNIVEVEIRYSPIKYVFEQISRLPSREL